MGVRVISDNFCSQFHKSKHTKALTCAGIPFKTQGKGFAKMHHKFAVVDKSVLINGSFNWTRQAEDGNQENMIVHRDCPDLVGPFVHEFNRLWSKFNLVE